MIEKMNDSFIISEMLKSFEISDYYTTTFDKEEISNLSNFIDYVEDIKRVRLPLIPVIDLWNLFMVERLDCNSCRFNTGFQDEFIEKLEKWAKEAYTKCYT